MSDTRCPDCGTEGRCVPLHNCPRRGELRDLGTYHRVYADQGKEPELVVSATEFGPLEKGDKVTLYDREGNKVRATVKRSLVAVVPDWSTYDNPTLNARQGTL